MRGIALVLGAALVGCLGAGVTGCVGMTGGGYGVPEPSGTPGSSESPVPSESSEPSDAPAGEVPRRITPADDGMRFSMEVDQTTTLRLAQDAASDPVASGSAVELILQVNVTDSGAREWEVRAVEPGTSVVSGIDGEKEWAITLIVTD